MMKPIKPFTKNIIHKKRENLNDSFKEYKNSINDFEKNKFDEFEPKYLTSITNLEIPLKKEKKYSITQPSNQEQKSLQITSFKHNEKYNVFFLMHGLEASPFDMRIIRAAILYHIPKSYVFLMKENHHKTNQSLHILSKEFAAEVSSIILTSMLPGKFLNKLENIKIIFVGHSLGGLIIRNSLKHLLNYKDKFYAYISLNTPHLGCSESKFLVKTGNTYKE